MAFIELRNFSVIILLKKLQKVGQGTISNACISKKVGDTWHPCSKKREADKYKNTDNIEDESRRKLLMIGGDGSGSIRRVLAGGGTEKCAEKARLVYSGTSSVRRSGFCGARKLLVLPLYPGKRTLTLNLKHGRIYGIEIENIGFLIFHKPTKLVKRGIFPTFFRSVPKVDYLTLRHRFIMAHLAPQSHNKFVFQKYINRSLEEDFKVVVGITPPIWFLAVVFFLFNGLGESANYLFISTISTDNIILLVVGTKLQVMITKMGLRIQERGEVVKGVPVVQPGDDLFWFNRPRLILFLITFVLFQNAFQLVFFAWTWLEFGLESCFHEQVEDIIIRISMGILIQILCSYVTLPLYALVTQMGSTMKPTIFNERVVTALKNWHDRATQHIKLSKNSGMASPIPGRPATPSHGTSPIHLLQHYRGEMDSLQTSPRKSNFDMDQLETDGSPSPSPRASIKAMDPRLPTSRLS
ncbi:MLO 6 [Olea europaea subsp. europaea]|uniref:MLO-like protein n=1 Tax=Olea europaea subsp. europaea TaxID=158383 RepID=A0A8S0RTV0_OLEEU|nr:MLO 6 [Olea europaea subsp. europaea]